LLIMEGQGVLAVVRLVEPLHHELVVRHPRLVKEVLAAMLMQVQQGLVAEAVVQVRQAV
jgi:hypothetical protein